MVQPLNYIQLKNSNFYELKKFLNLSIIPLTSLYEIKILMDNGKLVTVKEDQYIIKRKDNSFYICNEIKTCLG